MEKDVREDYEQISMIYKFFGDTNEISFGSGKAKNQQGQTKKI